MVNLTELTHYEYWLTKDVWSANQAIVFVVNHNLFNRSWKEDDDWNNISRTMFDEITIKLLGEELGVVFSKKTVSLAGYVNGEYQSSKLIIDESDVIPKEFIKWLSKQGYAMPFEFQSFIGLEEDEVSLRQRDREKIDKHVCQGIARTLWDICPDTTIEKMADEKAIQKYGSGRLYSTETTLRRWISEVDPRKKKTGPKRS